MPPGLERRSKLPGARPSTSASCLSWRRAWLWNARVASPSYATGFRKSKLEDVLGMIVNPRADDGRARRRALFHPRARPSLAALSLSGQTHRLGIDRRIERITTIGAYLEREALEKWFAEIR